MSEPASLEKVTAILLGDGWHSVTRFETFNLAAPVEWVGFSARESSGSYLFGPTSAIHALRGPRYVSPDELEAMEAEKRAYEDRVFEWQHHTDPDTYFAAATKQKGMCGGCGMPLSDSPITHFVAGSRQIVCQHCTPLVHRYGTP